MLPLRFLLLLPLWLLLSGLGAQSIGQQLERYRESVRMEKVYVSHDKPHYVAGETIWATVWLVDAATHLAYDGTPVVYVEWVKPDGDIAQSFTLQVENGVAELDIPTQQADTTGTYVLRAYSRYQRNFDQAYLFQKEILMLDQRIGEVASSTDVEAAVTLRFFPEGGHLVAGIESSVGFKATDEKGNSVSVVGELVDAEDRPISKFQSLHDGMGFFRHRPDGRDPAVVRVRHKGTEYRFPLPVALTQGYTLKGSSRDGAMHRISVAASSDHSLAGAVLVGHCRGRVFLEQPLPTETEFTLAVAKRDLPSGVLHFIVFDPEGRPVAERLLFNNNPANTKQVAVVTDHQSYGKRQPVELSLRSVSGNDSLSTTLSLSVYNTDDFDEADHQLNIRNYLLLQSDLRGRVNDIGRYFAAENARTNTLRDLLLLTHGWRKFDWLDVLAGEVPDLPFPAEEHLSLAGKVTKQDRDDSVKADVQFNVLSPDNFTSLDLTTGEDGTFLFTGFDFKDTVDVLLQASVHNPRRKAKLGKDETGRSGSRFVDITPLDLNAFPPISAPAFPAKIHRPQALKRYAFTTANAIATSDPNGLPWTVTLDEVTVTTGLNKAQLREKEFKRRYEDNGVFYFGGTPKFRADDPQFDGFKKDHIYELISLIIPRAYLVRSSGRPTLSYGSPVNGTTPIIVRDGQILSRAAIDNINPDDIAVIDLLEGLFSKIYSDDGFVIQLISKEPGEITRPNPGMRSVTMNGFYQARTFYAPDYASGQEPTGADYRNTLYWAPRLTLNGQQTTVTFPTGGKPGEYVIRAEGLQENGVPIVVTKRIRVE